MVAKPKRQRKIKIKEETVFQIVFFGLTLFLIGFLVVSNYRINKKRSELTKRIESLREEIQILGEKKDRLESGIIETEKESYWEEKIRDQGYVKEGENPVVVIPSGQNQGEDLEAEQNFSGGWLEKVKNFLARVIQW